MTNASTHGEWEARSARENLAILGWVRTYTPTESAVNPQPPAKGSDSRGNDPVARALSNWLWLGEGSAMTVKELFKLRAEGENPQELESLGWPTNPREMQERLEHVVPFLQGKNPFREGYPVWRDRYMYFEHWAKANTEEGLWVLVPAREGGPTEGEVEDIVWREVAYLEGLEKLPNPFRDI